MGSTTAAPLGALVDLLFQEDGVGRCLVAPDGTVLRANSEWLRSTGLALEDVVGADVVELFPASRELALALHARARAGRRVEVPRHAQRIAGRETWWEGHIDPVAMHGGTGLLITAREVTPPAAAGGGARTRPEPLGARSGGAVLLRAIAENVHDQIVVLEAERDARGDVTGWRYRDANDAALALVGTSREGLVGRTVAEILGARAPSAEERLARVLATGQRERYETTFRERTFLVTVFRVDADVVASTAVEITERKRAERALRDQERKYRSLFENSLDAVYLAREDGGILDANDAACRLHGMTVDEIRAAGRRGLVVNDARHAAAVRERAATGRVRAEMTALRKDGARIPVEVESVLVDRGEGTAFVISRDIAERKRAEEALRESEERFRALADHIAQLAWIADEAGRISWYNRRWLDYTGATLEQMQGRGWRELHHPDHADRVAEKLARCFRTGEPWEDTFPLRGKDGGYRWFLSRAAPIRDAAGRVTRWFGTHTDVTEQREAEEALRETDRRKDEFLGMLSHELRNPLAPIRNALYILDNAEPSGPQARRAKEIAKRQVAHLTRLVDDLLDVTRIARGKIELRRAELDLAALALRTAEDHRALMQDRGLELELDVAREPLVVDGDETRLAQVLGNLLSNAAKFTPSGGRVTLAVRGEGGRAVLHVRDTGPGIAPEMVDAIFAPFTQAEQTLARSEGGLGLGLALVKGLVALHGGEVRVASGGRGYGADFVVALPLAREAPPRDAADPAPER